MALHENQVIQEKGESSFRIRPNAGKFSDYRHSGEGQNPSQRVCRTLKWISSLDP